MQTIYLVTGLPGVGKTSFLQVLEGLKLLPEYSVTPQKIARIYNSSETYAMQKLIDDGRSFLCELPLEQEKMEQFFGLLEGKTYAINCYCMGLPDAAEAIARLVRRDRTGVPTAKILEDFELFPSNIRELSRRVESIKFFDNTHGFCLTGYYSAGKFMLSDAGHCVPWMQTVRAALLPNEQQITPESVWQTEIFERKVKENEEKSDGNRGETQRKRGKRKALELYCTDFAGTMQKDLQAVAEQILTQKYNKSVPKAVREYVELCSADEENSPAASSEK